MRHELPRPGDTCAPPPPPGGAEASAAPALQVTHAQRVIDPTSGLTKLDLVQHYRSVAALMIGHLRQRPLALLRAPQGLPGEHFFQKHLAQPMPGVSALDPALAPGHPPGIAINRIGGLVAAAQWNAIEFHTQNALSDRYERPNRLVFDLDPGDGLPWTQLQEAAQLLHGMLDGLGLPAYLKTSGGRGLHVVVPLRRQHGWDTVKGFSRAVVQQLCQAMPQRFTAVSGAKHRVGKVFVDYLRNGRGATTVSAWSARARPGMGVSVPVDWSELPHLRGGDHWTLHNIGERLGRGNRPWSGYTRSARNLTAAMQRLGYVP